MRAKKSWKGFFFLLKKNHFGVCTEAVAETWRGSKTDGRSWSMETERDPYYSRDSALAVGFVDTSRSNLKLMDRSIAHRPPADTLTKHSNSYSFC